MVGSPGVIGKGIRIKGDLTGEGDLVIEGRVEGRIQLGNHLTIESTGDVNANIEVERLTVLGKASGQIDATQKVEIKSSAVVQGEIRAPSVVIEEGAGFRGTIQMDVGIPDV
jgi:cytoskeletal protein CcmA (bactofilin family)